MQYLQSEAAFQAIHEAQPGGYEVSLPGAGRLPPLVDLLKIG